MAKKEKSRYTKDIIEIVAAFFIAWIFYQGLIFASGTPMPIVSVVSDSMEPVLHRGDLLFVTKPDDLKVDNIVIYQRPEVHFTIVHRIIKEVDGGYIIKGDNNPVPDKGIVQKSQILGKVNVAVPLLGYPRLALYTLGI